MPFCSNCGEKLADGAKFCSGCGTKVAAPAAPAEQPAPEVKEVKIEEVQIKTATTNQPMVKTTAATIKVCHGCGKPFELQQAKTIFGHIYHNECFKCHLCGMKLFSFSKYYNDDGEIMCHPCMLKTLPKCARYKKPIMGGYLTMNGANWHKECAPE